MDRFSLVLHTRREIMKKVVIAAIALLAIGNFAFAEFIVDMEMTTATNGGTVDPGLGGTGTGRILNLDPGTTGPVYVWIYARATTTNTSYNDAFLAAVSGNITEISAGVNGNMTWGTSKATNTAKLSYVYKAAYPAGTPDWSAGSLPVGTTNSQGDIEMNDPDFGFAAVAGGDYVDQGDLNSWSVVGHFTYTIKAGSAGQSQIVFTPWMTSTGASYQFGTTEAGPLTLPIDGTVGYSSSGPCTINIVPEPATLVLLGMSVLSLLFIRRRK
jgi:hypothetical protein